MNLFFFIDAILEPPIGLGKTMRVKEKSQVDITCMHENPLIFGDNVTWTYSNDTVISGNSRLYFEVINRTDGVTYTCNVMRNDGQTLTDFLTIIVECKWNSRKVTLVKKILKQIINMKSE